jgi:hypothetical protein
MIFGDNGEVEPLSSFCRVADAMGHASLHSKIERGAQALTNGGVL